MFGRRSRIPGLQELISFEAAGRLGSFTAAAGALALTQGAISRQISSLEETLGTPLFRRAHRRVELTDAGRIYLAEVTRTLSGLADATDRVATFGAADVVNLAVLPTFGARWLIPHLPAFARIAPKVTVNCLSRSEPFDFESEPFDAAIHFGTGDWPGAEGHLLCGETPVVVVGAALAERVRTPGDLRAATRLYQVTRLDAWDEWFAAQDLPAVGRTGTRYDQFSMLAEAAAAGLGAAIIPRFLVEADLMAGRLVEVPGRPVRDSRTYWLMLPRGKAHSPAVLAFRAWLLAETAGARDRHAAAREEG